PPRGWCCAIPSAWAWRPWTNSPKITRNGWRWPTKRCTRPSIRDATGYAAGPDRAGPTGCRRYGPPAVVSVEDIFEDITHVLGGQFHQHRLVVDPPPLVAFVVGQPITKARIKVFGNARRQRLAPAQVFGNARRQAGAIYPNPLPVLAEQAAQQPFVDVRLAPVGSVVIVPALPVPVPIPVLILTPLRVLLLAGRLPRAPAFGRLGQ